MKVIIPSYQRCGRVVSLEYAKRISDDIIISVQTAADYASYVKEYGSSARIVYRQADTAAGNRNTLLECLSDGEAALMLDDDVKRLSVCEGPKWKDVREATREDIEQCFRTMRKSGTVLGGFYPVNNPYFAFRGKRVTGHDILIGAAMLFIGGQLRFDESYEACEDYALVLGMIAGGHDVTRFNRILIDTTDDRMADALDGKTSGGMAEAYASGKHGDSLRRIAEEYWPIAKLGKNGTSISIDKGVLGL